MRCGVPCPPPVSIFATEAATELARLQAENEALRRERDEAREQLDHWRAQDKERADREPALEAAREAAEAKAARLEEALKQAEVWLSHMGYNIYGVLVKDDMPDHEPVLRAVRSALEAK